MELSLITEQQKEEQSLELVLDVVNSTIVSSLAIKAFLGNAYIPRKMHHYSDIYEMCAGYFGRGDERAISLAFRLLGITFLVERNEISGWGEKVDGEYKIEKIAFIAAAQCPMDADKNMEINFKKGYLLERIFQLGKIWRSNRPDY